MDLNSCLSSLAQAYYFPLQSQGSVYSSTDITTSSGSKKVIFGTLSKRFHLLEYVNDPTRNGMRPSTRVVSFSSIPSTVEIIAMDSFNKRTNFDDHQIGITMKKIGDGEDGGYLNIYFEKEPQDDNVLNIDSIAQNCSSLNLNFIPYHLTHTFLPFVSTGGIRETVWLLSGNDSKVHMYREDVPNNAYAESDISELFPELANTPDIVMYMELLYLDNFQRRVTAVGCESGAVVLSSVDVATNTITHTFTDVYLEPVSHVKLFSVIQYENSTPDDSKSNGSTNESENDIHLLICLSIGGSVVYRNVLEEGLAEKYRLNNTEESCLCAVVADIDSDGLKEILIGTYGRKILMYKLCEDGWEFSQEISTDNPVHCLRYQDLSGDGIEELIVQTSHGIVVKEHHSLDVTRMILARLEREEKEMERKKCMEMERS